MSFLEEVGEQNISLHLQSSLIEQPRLSLISNQNVADITDEIEQSKNLLKKKILENYFLC